MSFQRPPLFQRSMHFLRAIFRLLYVGTDTFLGHFLRSFGQKRMYVDWHFGPTLQNPDPKVLSNETKIWINVKLLKIRTGF